MDPQVYELIRKAHLLIQQSKGNMSERDLSYLSGLLEGALMIFSEPDQDVAPRKGLGKFLP